MFLRPRPAIRACGEQLSRPRHCFCRPRTSWLLSDHMRTSRCLEWQQPSHSRYRSLCSGFLLELAALLFLVSFVWASINIKRFVGKTKTKQRMTLIRCVGGLDRCSSTLHVQIMEWIMPRKHSRPSSQSRAKGEAKYRAGKKKTSRALYNPRQGLASRPFTIE